MKSINIYDFKFVSNKSVETSFSFVHWWVLSLNKLEKMILQRRRRKKCLSKKLLSAVMHFKLALCFKCRDFNNHLYFEIMCAIDV